MTWLAKPLTINQGAWGALILGGLFAGSVLMLIHSLIC